MINRLISIIIPCYNGAKYITETIQSVLNQSYQNFEIIVVNDGSTDNSLEVIQAISDKRIKLINQLNQGVSASRNNGMDLAQGDFIVFLDADDLLSKEFLQERLKYLLEHPKVVGVGGVLLFINEKSEKITCHKITSTTKVVDILELNNNKFSCPAAYMFNLKLLRDKKLKFNQNLQSSADRFFIVQVLKYYEIGCIDSVLYYRKLVNSMSHGITDNLLRDQLQYLKEIRKTELGVNKEYLSRLNYTIAGSSFHLKKFGAMFSFLLKSFFLSPKTTFKLIKK